MYLKQPRLSIKTDSCEKSESRILRWKNFVLLFKTRKIKDHKIRSKYKNEMNKANT